MGRSDRSVSVHVPIRLFTEEIQRGDLVARICEKVDALVKNQSHVAWVSVDERDRHDDGSSELGIIVHRCCSVLAETPAYTYEHKYRVSRVASGRYRLVTLN